MLYSYSDLLGFLPSNQKAHLREAIGCALMEVVRYFFMDLTAFLKHGRGRFSQSDFFLYNTGVTQLIFEKGVIHPLDIYGEQLSIVVHPKPFPANMHENCYLLSEQTNLFGPYRDCLGQVCQDVRIWKLKEDIDSEEAKEVAISYVLSNGLELFYCIYLHEDLDSDYLLLGDQVLRDKVESCFSIRLDCEISP